MKSFILIVKMSREIADKNETLFPIQVTTKRGPQKKEKGGK